MNSDGSNDRRGRRRTGGPAKGRRRKPERRTTAGGRAPEEAELKHEVARASDGTIFNARAIERQAASDPAHREAAPAIAASDEGDLYCCVCGSPLRRVFGGSGTRRWHFALRDAEGSACGHEPETEAHRAAKVALYDRLTGCVQGGHAGQGWEVHLEKALENGRRPDVLAAHSESGRRVAFEVQYADMSEEDLLRRRRDYAALGVTDLWLLGHHRLDKSRDLLARALAEAEDQRLIYVSDAEATEIVSVLSGSSPWGAWSLEDVDSRLRRRALASPIRRSVPGKKDTKGRGTPLCSAVVEPLRGVAMLGGGCSRGAPEGLYESAADGLHVGLRETYEDAERLRRIGVEAMRYDRSLQARDDDAASSCRQRLLALLKADRDAYLCRGADELERVAPEAVRRELLIQREKELAVFASALRWKSAVYELISEGVPAGLAADRVAGSVDHLRGSGPRAVRAAAAELARLHSSSSERSASP